MDKIRCERCGLEKGEKYPINVKYYERAKQTLCDCCIDIFDGNSWGYNSLKDKFGAEQAKKMLTLGFREVPYGFKINRSCIYDAYIDDNNILDFLERVNQYANLTNSELEADNKALEERIKNMTYEDVKDDILECLKEMIKTGVEIYGKETLKKFIESLE